MEMVLPNFTLRKPDPSWLQVLYSQRNIFLVTTSVHTDDDKVSAKFKDFVLNGLSKIK